MGCDIHLHAEKLVDGKWVHIVPPTGVDSFGDDFGYTPRWYRGRNYELFAVLAGVRNYGDITPIAEPRGIPGDISEETFQDFTLRVDDDKEDAGEDGYCSAAQAASWKSEFLRPGVIAGPDWHSASWFSVAELLAYAWDSEQPGGGWVTADVYQRWVQEQDRKGAIYPHCGDVSGYAVRHLSNQEMDELLASGGATTGAYTHIQWTETQGANCEYFLKAMRRLAQEADDPRHLRIVFWFDN